MLGILVSSECELWAVNVPPWLTVCGLCFLVYIRDGSPLDFSNPALLFIYLQLSSKHSVWHFTCLMLQLDQTSQKFTWYERERGCLPSLDDVHATIVSLFVGLRSFVPKHKPSVTCQVSLNVFNKYPNTITWCFSWIWQLPARIIGFFPECFGSVFPLSLANKSWTQLNCR